MNRFRLSNMKLRTKLLLSALIGDIMVLVMDYMAILSLNNMMRHGISALVEGGLSEEWVEYLSFGLQRFGRRSNLFLIVFGIFCVVVLSIILLSISRDIVKNFSIIQTNVETLAEGNLAETINEKTLNRGDDFGVLSNRIEHMRKSIRKLIHAVKDKSIELEGVVNNINSSMNVLSESVEDVSATTEELSAGMEETATSSNEVSYMAKEIESASRNVAEKAEDGSLIVEDIHNRAIVTKNDVDNSKEFMANKIKDIHNRLSSALESAKVVEQINVLTESIMDIAGQTNLLSLNASIEAARAGESGRGFAVVADEIRKLSEASKQSANDIREVIENVSMAVNQLTTNANELMEFIDNEVNDNLDAFGKFAEQYDNDANNISDLVSDFSATSEELLASVTNITESMNGVSTSNDECAIGVANIADKVVTVTEESNKVRDEAIKANDRAKELLTEVNKFTI